MELSPKKVLIVEASHILQSLIKAVLEMGGYKVLGQAFNAEDGMRMAFDLQPDFITLDNMPPGMIGIDILKKFKQGGLPSKVLLISSVDQHSIIKEALGFGAIGYLIKPFSNDSLLMALDQVREPSR